jgi:hypothetical protein
MFTGVDEGAGKPQTAVPAQTTHTPSALPVCNAETRTRTPGTRCCQQELPWHTKGIRVFSWDKNSVFQQQVFHCRNSVYKEAKLFFQIRPVLQIQIGPIMSSRRGFNLI